MSALAAGSVVLLYRISAVTFLLAVALASARRAPRWAAAARSALADKGARDACAHWVSDVVLLTCFGIMAYGSLCSGTMLPAPVGPFFTTVANWVHGWIWSL